MDADYDSAKMTVRWRGLREYQSIVSEMEQFTDSRTAASTDQIWLLEHPSVFTQGTSCRSLPHSNPSSIPVIRSNRGGQITYHGPGQLIVYLLLDLKRLGIGPKSLVRRIEQCVIDFLGSNDLTGERKPGAPGIYVAGSKIAALGLRIRNGRTFHGLSINVAPDLEPFTLIDPCGYPGQPVTSLANLGVSLALRQVGDQIAHLIMQSFVQPPMTAQGHPA